MLLALTVVPLRCVVGYGVLLGAWAMFMPMPKAICEGAMTSDNMPQNLAPSIRQSLGHFNVIGVFLTKVDAVSWTARAATNPICASLSGLFGA